MPKHENFLKHKAKIDFKEGLDEFFRGNSRIITDGRVCSIFKTLPGCRVYLDSQVLNVNIVVIVPIANMC